MSSSKNRSQHARNECQSPRGVSDLYDLVHNFEGTRDSNGSRSARNAQDGLFMSKGKSNYKMKEKRDQRRKAVASRKGAGEVTLSSVNEQRVKNRASVEKCRAKKKEHVDNLQVEQMELAKENEMMKRVLQMVEATSIKATDGR